MAICPVCDIGDSTLIASADPELVLSTFKGVLGSKAFSRFAANLDLPEVVSMWRCLGCSVEFFDPTISGGAEIYALSDGELYTDLRWDHHQVLDALVPGSKIIDFGGGSGRFASSATAQGCEVTVVDAWSGTEDEREVGGIKRIRVDLENPADLVSLANRLAGTASWVTGFQVVEHVRRPLTLTRAMFACLTQGGRVALSVPNPLRFDSTYLQPLDCPPHHQTRWPNGSLARLLEASGFSSIHLKEEVNYRAATILLGPLRWSLSRLRSTKSPIPTSIHPWPPGRLTKGLSLLAVGTK